MAPSLTSRPGRGLNLPNSRDVSSTQNAEEEKSDKLIKSTFHLLERGEKEIRFDDKHKDVILILGNTGSGKSTFTQWLAGDNTKMISKETSEGTGEYIIEDHNRIGDTTLKSKTVFPELVIDAKSNSAYYDCPGFSDTEGASHDIATTYFIKKVIDYSKSIKMVFAISHSSVRKGVDRQDFMKLVRHVTDLVKDIEKFKHSIAFVATKVDNQYIKQGKNFILVEDEKVIAAIADFLQEAKQYLKDSSESPNLSEKQKKFYKNAVNFIEVLLEKEGKNYPKIGIFRRPDEPGPISDIPLLQKGKKGIKRILYENLKFSSKTNEDFGYTVSADTKNDINDIVDEINKNLWSGLSNIARNIQDYYRNLVENFHGKIRLLITEPDAIDANFSDAEAFRHKFNIGYNITSDLIIKAKNLTNPEELAMIVNNAISKLNIDIPKHDIVYIANQGKYFTFLQTVSNRILVSKPWDELFKDVESFLVGSKTTILNDAKTAVEKINNRVQTNLNYIVKAMKEKYIERIKSLEIQMLPEKLNRDGRFIFELTQEIKNGITTEKLVNVICHVADNLDVSLPKENLQNIRNQGKCLMFLEIISNETLVDETITWLLLFKNMVKYLYEFEKWYIFLEDLHKKFSEYDIQKNRQRYNVADLEDWGQSGKLQGISVTPKNFEKFLNKIGRYNVTEYETVKNLTATDSQIDELNQVLSLTLKHRPTVRCSETYIIVKGNFISLNEAMQNLRSNFDTNNSCANFKSQLAAGKYSLLKVFALNTVFIDADLPFSGQGTSATIISPKWEVVGSRSIDLHGANGDLYEESKAKNGAHPGSNGENGAPGKPGRSGESFFGIGSAFVNGANLEIISTGGQGGRGQDGGDGAVGVSGRNAETPSNSDPPCKDGYVRGFRCEEIKQNSRGGEMPLYVLVLDLSNKSVKPFKIFGLPGGKGGNGGNGGKGGKGGYPGTISILALTQPSEVTKLMAKGKEGGIGKGGKGSAVGGKNGDDIIANFIKFSPNWVDMIFGKKAYEKWEWKETIRNNGRGPDGSKGHDGVNAVGLQDPLPANGIHKPSNIINEYKIYLRENINNRFKKHTLLQFLDEINNKDGVRKLYDTFALIDEFQGLEEQFHKLNDQMNFSPFYSSLAGRVEDFAKNFKDGPSFRENKKVVNYLYTAILGRMYNLRENSEQNLIIDIHGYLNLVIENIKALKDLQKQNSKVNVMNKSKENYKNDIDKKIKEAKSFIERQISPEIENINTEINDRVNFLIEETIALQKQAAVERQALAQKKKELETALAMKGMFGLFQIIGRIVSVLGPIGAIAGTMIEATRTVGESLVLSNLEKTLILPSDVVSAITSISDQIKTIRNRKFAYLSKLLDNVSQEIKKNPEKLNDMARKITDIKDRLKKAVEKKMDFEQVKILEGELKWELKRKGDDLKIHSSDKKSEVALEVIGKITQIVEFGSLMFKFFNKMKEDNEKMDTVTDAMEKIEDKIKKLRDYEENIYCTIVPMLQEMEDQMKDISKKLGSKSQVSLDVTKWQVQSTLKDMRLQMQRLTEGFKIKDDLGRSIEKLNEVMTTLINVYDRIQSYQDQQNLANYIADISSVTASSINIKNQQLVNAINHLEFAIRANIVLKQYKSAINAFKQWVFPFSDHYTEKSMLPSELELNTNIEDLVENAVTEIEGMKKKIDSYDISVKNGDEYLQCEEFSSRYVSSQPFHVWNYEEYGSITSGLMSGKEVVLKADITKSVPHKDAIKFTEIDFDFKTKNKSAQSVLSETLKGFDIRATHLGNSYYRYTDKIFLITSDSVTISYSHEKNDDGMPIRSNNAYNKLKSGDILLSPYTLWEVKMINITKKYSFQDLERFKNEINVELSGFGSYVNTNVFGPASVVYNSTNLQLLRSKAAGVNQCKRSKYRVVRSLENTVVDDHMTNTASAGISSPINFLYNFLKTYLISIAIIPIIQIFDIEQMSVRNYDDSSELPYEVTEPKNGLNVVSNPTITDTENIEISAEGSYNNEKIVPKSDSIFITNFDGDNSCSKVFLLNEQKNISKNLSIQVPDLSCSLLLADLITRTVTGNRYKSPIDECLLSPPEVLLGKISDGMVQSESEVKHLLQRLLSEKEESPRAWFSKLNGYAKSIFQFLGLVGNEDIEEYVQDVRNLFS